MIRIGSLFLLLYSSYLIGGHNQDALAPYDKIIIYQFGKTGSTSLFTLFGDLTIETPIEKVPDHPTKGKAIHSHIDEVFINSLAEKENILVINVVRNLFDRNISHFFHNLRQKNNLSRSKSTTQSLFRQYKNFNLTTSKALASWYDRFAKLFDIDLFSKPFDHRKKFVLLKRENVTILIVRFEDIAYWPAIFHQTLDLQGITIPKLNVGDSPHYNFFKSEYNYSENEIKLIRSINFMTYFYTEQEIRMKIKRL